MLQHTPRDVIENPPSSVILPPEVAEVAVILVISFVITVGKPSVVKLISFP
ncbi:hypothetical protein ES705_42068 [subsurface metagenome]